MSDNRKPAVGYIRMSTDQQQDSPARQRQDINSLADRQGFKIIRWYEDHGLTGTESSKRREFQKLLADAKAGTFAAVLVSEQSRMSREDIFDVILHWKLLRDAGVAIVTCQRGELHFDNLGGFLTAIVDQYGAREESIRLADRVVSGKRLAIRQGQRQGGALFGYDREILDEAGRVVRRVCGTEKFRKPPGWSSRLVPALDSKAVKAVRFIFESIGDGLSYGSVARELNRRGCTTLAGKRFNGTVVRRIVTNPVYAGDLVLGRKRRGRFRSLHDEGGITHENVHEPLVSRQVFARAQDAVQRRYRTPRATTPGRYLLTSLVYLAGSERRLHGYTMRSNGRLPRRYYGLASRFYEEYPQESDRPSFRAEVVENAVMAKLRDYLADKRNQRAIQAEISRRTRKAQANVEALEKQLGAVRARIERGTENLALANPEDVPGISRLLARWRDEEAKLKEKLQQARGEGGPTPESLAIMARIDQLLDHLNEADREKLAFAIRQTVKRITLRRTRLGDGRCRVTLWDGAIELRDDLGPKGTIPLTDDDLSGPGRWRDAARFVREHAGAVYLSEVAEALRIHKAFASRLLAQATLAGKIRNLGHQRGWTAASARS